MISRQTLRRFAPIGLVISGLAALSAFVLYILYRSFDLPLQISLGLIVLGLALYVLLDPQKTREVLTGRQARYGSNSLIMTIAVVGILVVINWLVFNYSKQWDLTEDKQNTLTAETLETLKSLKDPVIAEAYYSSQMSSESARNLLQSYQTNSNGKFTYEMIDPVQDPLRAQSSNVTRDATIVLKMDDRQEQISYPNEEEITGALVRLANPGERAVYFLTGHGEKSTDSAADVNYSQVKSALEAKNYTVSELNLLSTPSIPDDALALIIAGPVKPLSDQEITLIKAYQEKGGALVYLAEPSLVTEFGGAVDPMIDYLKSTWGIALDEDIIIDFTANNNEPFVLYTNRFGSHPITERMYSLAVMAPTSRSVRSDTAPENVQLTEITTTTENAWGETDYDGLKNNQANPDPDQDKIGPVSFAVAGENSSTSARVVVIGDSDFASSTYFTQLGNSDLILNSIDWAAEQDNLISLTPREPIERMIITPDAFTLNLLFLGSIFLLPAVVVVTGVSVWLQRRRKG